MLAKFAALAFAASALAQTFSISTPASLVECQPASITWTGGTANFILAVIPGGETSAAALETLSSSLTASPYTWTVNLASGTNVTLKLTDSTGTIAYSSPVVIQAGASDSCLNASASTSGISTTGAVTTTVTSATSGAASATSATTSATPTSMTSASAAASSAAASSTAASSAAASSAAASSAAASSAGGAIRAIATGVPAAGLALLGGVALLL